MLLNKIGINRIIAVMLATAVVFLNVGAGTVSVRAADTCFNSITFGNELKPAYNFDPASATLFKVDPAAEELLNWARQHEMPVRGLF